VLKREQVVQKVVEIFFLSDEDSLFGLAIPVKVEAIKEWPSLTNIK